MPEPRSSTHGGLAIVAPSPLRQPTSPLLFSYWGTGTEPLNVWGSRRDSTTRLKSVADLPYVAASRRYEGTSYGGVMLSAA